MTRSIEDAEKRISELERLISNVRHDVNGALTTALMVSDRLTATDDPLVKRAGEKISMAILRVTALLKATRDVVPALRHD